MKQNKLLHSEWLNAVKTAFRDVSGWYYDPVFYTYYHPHTNVFFHEECLSIWKWDVRIVPHHHVKGAFCPYVHWPFSQIVLSGHNIFHGLFLRLTIFKHLAKIKAQAKFKCCFL